MALKRIDLNTTPLTLEELLATLDSETEVLLVRGGAPIARLLSVQEEPVLIERIFGLHEGGGWTSDDFDDELPASFWLGKNG